MTDKDRNSEIKRAIWREKLQDHLLVLILIFVLFGFAIASILYTSPGSVEFKKATIEKVGFGHGESGGFPIYAAKTVDGKYLPHVSRSLDMPAALSVGETVCLRIQKYRFAGRISARHAPENPTCRPNFHTTK